jgi:predicted ATPase/DNA-binding winged helix-turn-helix (wHTH) protein
MTTVSFGPFRLLPEQRILLADDKPVRLGSRALDILITLLERPGELVTKDEILRRVWPDTIVEETSLRVHIGALRKVLGDGHGGARYVANVPGRGYCFVALVERRGAGKGFAASVPAPLLGNLPAPLTRMIGRDETVANLASQLATRRFVSIVGPGGIGKTTVAVAVAEAVAGGYEHSTRFLDLGALADPALVATALASALGVAVYSDDPVPGLLAFLADRQMLIVFDTCEHVIEAAAAVAEAVLRGAPRVHVLATSREPLRAEGEWVHRLASLESPPAGATLDAAAALRFPAVQLFVERSTAASDSFSLADADVQIVSDICRRLDGIPLAIELAAAAVDMFGVRELAVRLDDRLSVLTRGRRTALPRHQTLRATLDWSYGILPEEERVVLRRLAVFAHGFSLDSAAAIAADDRISSSRVCEAVTSLTAKSLLAADVSGDVVRYRLLDMTRAHALEKLRESDERARIFRHHAEHCGELLRRAATDWETQPSRTWRETYGRQIDDVRAALNWAFSPDGDTALGLALTAESTLLWIELSLLEEHRQQLARALACIAASPGADPAREMQLNAALGNALFHTVGPSPEAAAAFGRSLEIAERLGDAPQRLKAFSGLCAEHLVRGQYPTAVAFSEQFKRALGANADPAARVISDRLLALSLHFQGDQPRARELAECVRSYPVTAVHRTHNTGIQFDQRVAAGTLLARIMWLQGLADQAARTAQETADFALAIDHPISACYTLALAAYPVSRWSGDDAAAARYLAQLSEQSIRHSLVYWQSWARGFELLERLRAAAPGSGAGRRRGLGTERLPNAVGPQLEVLATLSEEYAATHAVERADSGLAGWCAAELRRLRAESLLREQGPQAAGAVDAMLADAQRLAHTQGALAWELRVAISRARLWQGLDRSADAARLLESVRRRFHEGLATADLRAADALLVELAEVASA